MIKEKNNKLKSVVRTGDIIDKSVDFSPYDNKYSPEEKDYLEKFRHKKYGLPRHFNHELLALLFQKTIFYMTTYLKIKSINSNVALTQRMLAILTKPIQHFFHHIVLLNHYENHVSHLRTCA